MEDRVRDIASIPVHEIMTRNVITVSPDLEALKAGPPVWRLPVPHSPSSSGKTTNIPTATWSLDDRRRSFDVPGEYKVTAWDDVDAEAALNPLPRERLDSKAQPALVPPN